MGPTPERSIWSAVRLVTMVLMIGAPAFAFLVVITWGAILTPLFGVLLLTPFVAVNYLLWGRLFAPGKPATGGNGDDEVRSGHPSP
jgi:hypothetical protein